MVFDDSCSIDSSELLSEKSYERESESDIEEEIKVEKGDHGNNCFKILKNEMPENSFFELPEARA